MKRSNQNQIQTNKSKIRPPGLSKQTQKHYTRVGTAIFAVTILHFVTQFIFFQGENSEGEKDVAKTENQQIAEPKPQFASEIVDDVKMHVPAPPPVVRAEPKTVAEPRAVVKKKEQPRESRAERLRRAERILTGV